MSDYRVVIVSPEGYIHSACFRELAILIVSTFRTIGISCDFSFNEFSTGKINIVLGYHLLDYSYIKNIVNDKNIEYIVYQLEQLTADEFSFNDRIRLILNNAISIWDYSNENIGFLKKEKIDARYIPIGYHRELEIIKTVLERDKDIDILFYGSIGDRRKEILDTLSKKYNIKVLFGVYGNRRDEFIGRAKIVLNIHHYSSQLLETVRLSYLLNNRIFIISEDSLENPYSELNIEFSPYDDIISRCSYYLKNDEIREQKRKRNYVKFKKEFPMENFLKQIID